MIQGWEGGTTERGPVPGAVTPGRRHVGEGQRGGRLPPRGPAWVSWELVRFVLHPGRAFALPLSVCPSISTYLPV